MPRQGVPYPSREICSLKCQIDALNAKINELMKSINGVQGDGQGNLSLVSGDPAIVINNDAAQNQIEIALDGSQLPAAAVSSVNSQTGAVVLEADDIPSDGNSDVQADIDALKALGVNLQGAIGNEVTSRGNADAALQGNINTLQASIPGEAANAVANDPTVIQLATDVPNKLDKITSGSSLKAYTHTGATQGEKSVVDGTTADSIAIRDANGRLQAADPASGATDKTLVTSNWVSQTGNSSPNNLVHRSGAETKTGKFTMDDGMIGYQNDWHQTDKSGMNLNDYCIFAKIAAGYGGRYLLIDFCQSSNTACAYGRLMLRRNVTAITPVWLFRKTNGANNPLQSDSIHVLQDGTDIYLAWKKLAPYGSLFAAVTFDISYGTVQKVSNQNVTWYTTAQMIVTNDISAYTDVPVVE